MKTKLLTAILFTLLNFTSNAQCHYIPATASVPDTLSWIFIGGAIASYGCLPIDPTYWMNGSGDHVTATFVHPQSHPGFRVWGINDDDVASVTVNGVAYPLNSSSASYAPKVVCGISPGPDGILFANGNVVGANSNTDGNYSYQDITINATNVTSLTVSGLAGAGWGFAGITLSCLDTATSNNCNLSAPVITASIDTICPGDSVSICAPFNFVSYHWNTQDTFFCTRAKSAGNYYVTVTDGNNCTAESNHLSISVYQSPPVSISIIGDTLSVYNVTLIQWYLNDTIIPGATANTYLATGAGDYKVRVTDSNGCSSFSIPVTYTGIKNIDGLTGFTIYPNPFNSFTTMRWEQPITNAQLNIYNLCGQIVRSIAGISGTQLKIDRNNLPEGLYYMRLIQNENVIAVGKITIAGN